MSQPLSSERVSTITSGADITDVLFPVTRDRLAGYRQAAEDADIAWRDVVVAISARNDAAEAERIAATLLASPDPPDAIAAMSDEQAAGVIRAARAAGRRHPRRSGDHRVGRRGSGGPTRTDNRRAIAARPRRGLRARRARASLRPPHHILVHHREGQHSPLRGTTTMLGTKRPEAVGISGKLLEHCAFAHQVRREVPAVAGQEQRPAELTAGSGTGRVGAETAQQYQIGLRELPSSKRFQVVGHARPTSATSKLFHHPPKEPDLKMIRPVVMRVESSEADPQPPPCLSKSRARSNRFCPFGRNAASVDASDLRAAIFIAAKSPRREQHRHVRHGLPILGKGAAVERHGGAAA